MKNSASRNRFFRVLNCRHRQAARASALMAAAALGAATGAQAQNVDLSLLGSTHPGFRIDGVDVADVSGFSVSSAGDVNGDGLADLIVGASGGDTAGGTNAGHSYVVFGKESTFTINLQTFGTSGFRIDGIAANDRSGWSVSGAGDVNGDGLADVIVGAFDASPLGRSNAGESYVVFGKADNSTVDLSAMGTGGFRIAGSSAGISSGRSVSGAGDVNGDGLADVILGAPTASSATGRIYVVFGKADTTTVDLLGLGTGGFRIVGDDVGDRAGESVSGAGDVNGDGLADLIVGARTADPGGDSSAGESYVVFGKTDSTTVDLGALGTGGFRIEGIDAEDYSGRSVAGAGDVNGDGLADLIVGALYGDPDGDYNAGESYVVFGKSDSAAIDLSVLGAGGFRIDGRTVRDYSGRSVSSAGDVNGDGFADVILGSSDASSETGESYLVFGKADGTTVELSSLSIGGFRIDGVDALDRSGYSVSGAGDVNGDGLADLIIGAWGGDANSQESSGHSYVVFSPSTPPASASCSAFARPGDAPKLAIGGAGDGSFSLPDSRCWIDFDAGDNGSGGASLQTVTLNRNQSLGTLASPTVWEITTDRVGWTAADVTFKYTDAEITGLTEANLTLYKADSLGGPYTPLTTTVDTARNTVSATVSSFSFFAIGDNTGLPVDISHLKLE